MKKKALPIVCAVFLVVTMTVQFIVSYSREKKELMSQIEHKMELAHKDFIFEVYDLVERVVSSAKLALTPSNSLMRVTMRRPAMMDILSGLNGERPLAISSAFTNSRHCKISGSMVYDAVVFPAPLQPAIM